VSRSTPTPSAAVVDFLASLPPGSIVAQLDDGSIAVCKDVDEADQRITESRKASGRAATLLDRKDTSTKYVEATA
jgi:hypothetical protein